MVTESNTSMRKSGVQMIKHLFCSRPGKLGHGVRPVARRETPRQPMARYAETAVSRCRPCPPHAAQPLYRTEPQRTQMPGSERASCPPRHPKQADALAPATHRTAGAAANPERFTDAAKVEKWFPAQLHDVLQRECSAQEKAISSPGEPDHT